MYIYFSAIRIRIWFNAQEQVTFSVFFQIWVRPNIYKRREINEYESNSMYKEDGTREVRG